MRVEHALKQGLARVGRHWRVNEYAQALEEVDRLLTLSPANPRLLVLRAQLIPLQVAEPGSPTLDEAEADLRLAAKLDESSPVPLIELGYFIYAIKDDPRGASRLFRDAIQQCKDLLREALLGQAKTLSELDREAEAVACLAEVRALRRSPDKEDDRDFLEHVRAILQSN